MAASVQIRSLFGNTFLVSINMSHSPDSPSVEEMAVTFFQGNMAGWIHINLHVSGQTQKIWATSLFPPFESLLAFLEAVLYGPLPAQFAIDEEGCWKIFQALPDDNPKTFYFRLVEPEKYNEALDDIGEIFLAGEFHRGQFALAFAQALLSFLEREYNPKCWGPRNTLPAREQVKIIIERALMA